SALWLAFGFSSWGAVVLPQLPYNMIAVVEAIFFGVVFLRYGLLATMGAALTVETALFALPFWVVFRRLDPLIHSLPLLAWLLALSLAAMIYSRSELINFYRRAVQVFE